MKPRIILAAFIIPLGLIIAAVPSHKTLSKKVSPENILNEVKSGHQLITTDQVAKMIIEKDPSFQLIDLRSPEEYAEFSLPGSVNIPLDNILSEEWTNLFDQQIKINILYSNGTTKANEAWMILRQKGYTNNYVMLGGLNYWAETIMNPDPPENIDPDDEIAKYNFRKGAGQALGGENQSVIKTNVTKPDLPVIQKTKKKKRAAGGC